MPIKIEKSKNPPKKVGWANQVCPLTSWNLETTKCVDAPYACYSLFINTISGKRQHGPQLTRVAPQIRFCRKLIQPTLPTQLLRKYDPFQTPTWPPIEVCYLANVFECLAQIGSLSPYYVWFCFLKCGPYNGIKPTLANLTTQESALDVY
jgi:hypothetical protein